MPAPRRTDRLNSLLKEVISDVIRKDVKNPHVSELVTVTRVDVTRDLHYAKVYVSIIGDGAVRKSTVDALQSAAGYIGRTSSKKVVLRYFPALTFYLDDSLDAHMRIDEVLHNIHEEESSRPPEPHTDDQKYTEGQSA